MWTLFKQLAKTVDQDDAHGDIVTCMAMSKDGKTAITGIVLHSCCSAIEQRIYQYGHDILLITELCSSY